MLTIARWMALLTLPLLAAPVVWRQAVPGYRFSFPLDHFEHPDFRTEWWYYTGNVWTSAGRRFGFELVFFRFGDRSSPRENTSVWRVDDLYFANAALTDVSGRRFLYYERLNRAGPGIAGASFDRKRIWNGNWSDTWNEQRQTLKAATPEFSLSFDATPAKPFVLEGDNGLSRKAAEPGRASYYVSNPLLRVQGSLRISGKLYHVSGQAWMDHEWFTNQLAADQAGWDWFSVQLDDSTELMLFELRRKDGGTDRFSSGEFIDRDGKAIQLNRSDFALEPSNTWRSPKSGARYPVQWRIRVPRYGVDLLCRAALDNQELVTSQDQTYWEGAVNYSGTAHGVGYLEMTGYAKPVGMRN